MLTFIERMANADGLYKRVKKGNDLASSIKCNLMDKKDLLEPFRNKYSWYFNKKYGIGEFEKKKKNF